MVLAQLSPNVPRSLSWVKVGTPIGFARRIAYKRLHSETRGPLPWPQRGLVLPAKSSPKEQPEEADARLWRVSASFGVAAPLGCVIFFCFCQNCGLHTMCSVLSACARRGVVSPLLVCSACCRNSRPPLVKTANLPFSEIGKPSLIPAVQNVSRVLQKQQQFTANSPGPL